MKKEIFEFIKKQKEDEDLRKMIWYFVLLLVMFIYVTFFQKPI